MISKFFIDKDGSRVIKPKADHADVAREVLASHGITPKDYLDLYTQMFALGYARASVDQNEFHIEAPKLTRAQLQVAQDALIAGKEVYINDRRYVESKTNNGAKTLVEQLLGECDF